VIHPPVAALGQGSVGEPGDQPSGVFGTAARRRPEDAHCGGRNATTPGEHGELPVTVPVSGGKIVDAQSDRGQDTGVLVVVRAVLVGDRFDVGGVE
jgi:hypothetical protein